MVATAGSQSLKALLKLRELILSGKLRAGERISEHALVRRLGVSRTPVRAAIQTLESEGLCKPAVGGGYEINSFSISEVIDAIDVRATLEGMAARTAAIRGLRRADLLELKACLQKLDVVVQKKSFSLDDLLDFARLNTRFHNLFVQFSGNLILQRALDRVLGLPFVSPSAFVFAQSELPEYHEILMIGQEQHRSLVAAIETGESALAESIAREHAEIAKCNLKAASEDPAILERVPGWSLIRRTQDEVVSGKWQFR
jgi:GntR family transcriptional regulator of vanillate catabolism